MTVMFYNKIQFEKNIHKQRKPLLIFLLIWNFLILDEFQNGAFSFLVIQWYRREHIFKLSSSSKVVEKNKWIPIPTSIRAMSNVFYVCPLMRLWTSKMNMKKTVKTLKQWGSSPCDPEIKMIMTGCLLPLWVGAWVVPTFWWHINKQEHKCLGSVKAS
jgi:hypothetical protein